MLPVSGEQHERAVIVARYAQADFAMLESWTPLAATEKTIAAYFESLAAQGVRLVDAREVVEWLRQIGMIRYWSADGIADAFLARFGGGDDHRHERLGRDCVVCGAGPTGRCDPPDDYEGDCPHGCSPER
jgi:hypothetical protein